jgi:hypothetical protein
LIVKKLFTENEVSFVEKAIKSETKLQFTIIDIRENILTIFVGNKININFKIWDKKIDDYFKKPQVYSPKMRFIKANGKYFVQRMCYLGSIDDWIDIDKSDNFEELTLKYCYHLDKDSFFELG